ncbi:MAG: GAF domain-containing protein, partial [Pseudohongiella sp.]|uniref:GAF domain-containing protein n=1 Tax=Pseudohongiella sp. TaxID=1979412 RepID=UPI00349FE35D
LDYLSSLDCDQAQGYYIARPMRGDDVDDWFQKRELQRELARVQALKDIGVLDTDPESRFDVITQLARKLLKAPVSFISLVDENRQWFKSANGINFTETPRDESFCSLAIQSDGLFVVEDALDIPLLADNPLVIREPGIRSYAGIPLIIDGGHAVGALCVCDTEPRRYSEREKQILEELARLAQRELRTRVEKPPLQSSPFVDGLSKQEFRGLAETIWAVSQNLNLKFSTISLKIDGLELINERFGRSEGDACLKAMAALVNSFAGQTDLTGRARNTLLTVHMIDCSDEQLEVVAQELQAKLEDWESHNGALAEYLKLSHGIYSCLPQDHANLASVVEHAIRGLERHQTPEAEVIKVS